MNQTHRNESAHYSPRAEAEAIFTSLGDGAIATDANGRISRVNQKAVEILGFSPRELLGKWFPDIVINENEHGKAIHNLDRPISLVFLTGKVISTRTNYRRKDGSPVPVYLTASPIMVDGRPVGAVLIFRDITEELALERAKDEFVAIASHQLRTPATAVKQYVGLLLENYAGPLSANQRLFLERAYESNERQLNIIQEILRVTQLDLEKVVLKLSRQDLRPLVRRAADSVKSEFAARRQKLIIKEPDQPVAARVDADQIASVIENLLENASHYTWEGRTVTISSRALKNRVKVSVKDQGVGIDPADFPKLFQKFSRLANPLSMEASGTGLGLFWAAQIVQLHGGAITVKSALKKGSTFNIELPRAV